MRIRSYSWGAADLSWSVVIEEILHAAEEMGHQVDLISTNGTAGMKYWNDERVFSAAARERDMQLSGTPYDIDLTFTVPNNYGQRFLKTSKVKLAITDYESNPVPPNWKQWFHIPDKILPGSTWVADALVAGGCPRDKLAVVPHGVDTSVFNPNIEPHKLNTSKSFKFLCIAEPHYRKQIDVLIDTYCKTFKASDDVCLIIKTKLFKPGDSKHSFEQDLRPIIAHMAAIYKENMPEIKIISQRIPNIAALYTACDVFVLMTAAEGFGVPFLESLACGIPVIAPRFGGQLDFLNDTNSILCSTKWRAARPQEKYWGQHPSRVGNPNTIEFAQAMVNIYKDYQESLKDSKHIKIRDRLLPSMLATAESFTWKEVVKKIIKIAQTINPTVGLA